MFLWTNSMATKAIISKSGSGTTNGRFAPAETDGLGIAVEAQLPQGTLITGNDKQYAMLEKQGYRVKLLPDTHLLAIGSYHIDIEKGEPRVPSGLDVPKELAKVWLHHLVQLQGPPNAEWNQTLEEHGVEIVEPIGSYGLFVTGTPEAVQALRTLPFVAWTGPFKPAYRIHPNLAAMKGRIQFAGIGVYPESEVDVVRQALTDTGSVIVRESAPNAGYQGEYHVLIVEMDAKYIPMVAALRGVRWLEFAAPQAGLDGERETQILAENLNAVAPPNTAPVTGYQPWLAAVGLNGSNATVAICDTGVDANGNNNANGHLDIRGRLAAFVDYTGGANATDIDGHGTHVAGIAIGNAATGQTEAAAPNNFLWGQGVAPQSQYVVQNAISIAAPWPPANFGKLTQDAVTNGADVMNNSWHDGTAPLGGAGYTANTRRFDQLVRDPNESSAELDHLALVFSAGNAGGGPSTLTPPHEAKNIIVVGNSLTSRPASGFPSEDINGINGSSSRGPAIDGRIMPTIVAPGTNVSSTWSETGSVANYGQPIAGTGTPDPMNPANLLNQYMFMSGTSMSAPMVSGTCALLTQWWRERTNGKNPSPALLKALLVNGAEDLAGGQNWRRLRSGLWAAQGGTPDTFRCNNPGFIPAAAIYRTTVLAQAANLAGIAVNQWFFDAMNNILYVRLGAGLTPGNNVQARDTQAIAAIPNNDQGWGRVSLENILLQAPVSDRGPKLFSDQRHAFTADGQEFLIRVAPVDAARPMRITLAWTDAPGAANANPALVNDLDLEVRELNTADVYRGNVFSNGFSTTGGAFDTRNNVECVYIQNPAGTYEVRVIASSLSANARPPFDNIDVWQDFALVLDNAEVPPAAPVSVVPVIDRSGSMVSYGYVDTTRTSSKLFVDMLGIDDRLGVVSFGDSGTVNYPPGPMPALQQIVGQPTRDAANNTIDDIVFNGCTFMGDGIEKARDLLAPAMGSRAMVLFSDGYDNKGCDMGNPAKPSALDAVAALPAGMPVYTCAMGPSSDQALLEQIAVTTNGHYYFMPTIDDLYEIYNYIRGQITDTGIIVNEAAFASRSRVGAFVDAGSRSLMLNVAWNDTSLKYTAGEPRKKNEISIRLRTPQGKLLHPHISDVRTIVGEGYVIFTIQEPAAGQWYVEVETARTTHTRYTVGGFVDSPIRLIATLPGRMIPGKPLNISAQVFDGKVNIPNVRARAHVVAPMLGIPALLDKYKSQLARIKPVATGGDSMPDDVGRLLALRAKLAKDNQPHDIFTTITSLIRLSEQRKTIHGKSTIVPVRSTAIAHAVDGNGMEQLEREAFFPSPGLSLPTPSRTQTLAGRFGDTRQQGSYNVIITANGISPQSGTRFVRKQLMSLVIR